MFDPVRSFAVGNIIAPTARQKLFFHHFIILNERIRNNCVIDSFEFEEFYLISGSTTTTRPTLKFIQKIFENYWRRVMWPFTMKKIKKKKKQKQKKTLARHFGRRVAAGFSLQTNERTNETICSCTVCVCVREQG